MDIDNFVQELTCILVKTTEETVKWNTHSSPTSSSPTNDATSPNEVTNRKDNKFSEFCHVPAGQLPGNTIRFQNKINHTLFKKANLIKGLITRVNSVHLTHVRQHKKLADDPRLSDYTDKCTKEIQEIINNFLSNLQDIISQEYNTSPCQQEEDKSPFDLRQRELTRQIGTYLQKCKKPSLQLITSWKDVPPSEVIYSNNKILRELGKFQNRLLRKFRNALSQLFLEEDLKKLSTNSNYIFKILRKRTNQAFQHKLSYILKYDQQKYQILHKRDAIFKEITNTYEKIYNNGTTYSDSKHHWFATLPQIHQDFHQYLNSNFEDYELSSAVHSLHPFSSGGTDNIVAKMLHVLINDTNVSYLLLKLYNAIKSLNYVPLNWRNSITTLVHKPGSDPHSVNGYRPISLLSVLYKVYTCMLNNRCTVTIEKYNLIPATQNGFRPGKETSYCVNTWLNSEQPIHNTKIFTEFI
jgi:hypothetical protein